MCDLMVVCFEKEDIFFVNILITAFLEKTATLVYDLTIVRLVNCQNMWQLLGAPKIFRKTLVRQDLAVLYLGALSLNFRSSYTLVRWAPGLIPITLSQFIWMLVQKALVVH